ncbi:MAG: zinc ribbon domain-containing protein [Methanobrevibacter sp.]|uniref:zinc-ribbon domain-containing protein n=1 Tax=Methanobrevibacter sp. TaxID=66852 RepID=UPI0025EFE955|nr:zinc-ribbon domain-containing protein [Methanobrevibacter sp.]MBQ6139282.1 zinc ribbon domain-containing protein [Methanobrevibacter sp.]
MVFCPNCGAENADSAKFCKSCGHTLAANSPIKDNYVNTGIDPSVRVNDNSNLSNPGNASNNSKSDNKNLIIICLTIVICALLIAGAMVMFSNNNANDNDSDSLSDSASLNSDSSADNVTDIETSTQATQESYPQIYSGSFSTGSSASDKTHCTIYVGSEHAGEKVKISVLYLNDGYALNQGKVVTKTVSSDGYVKVASANAFEYYPDEAHISLYDSNGDILDTKTVYLYENSGKQIF